MVLEGFTDGTALLRCGIYALTFSGQVVYVGKAKKLLTRVYSHRYAWERRQKGMRLPVGVKAMQFSGVWVRLCLEEDLDRLEKEMIAKYRPKYNERHLPKVSLSLPQGLVAAIVARQPAVATFERRV